MQCTSPVWLKERGLYVPCNHCVSCRISYSREWAVRLMNEFETSHNKGCFITLTYSDEHLPADLSLHKEDLQKFFKRLRKHLKGHQIKYYACGEYGDKFKRPHYHAIIFNLSVMDAMIVLPKAWQFGFFKILPVYYESCKYVTGYVMKKYNGEKAKEEYGNKEVPFRLSSLGLGKEFALEHRDRILEDYGVTFGGVNKGFPKYYQMLFKRDDMSALADEWTENPCDWKSLVADYKENSWLNDIKTKAKENHANEVEKYNEWLEVNKPDDIVECQPSMSFESWKKSVDKLRDLTVKAKCALHEKSKEF